MPVNNKSAYAILGLHKGAVIEEIKAAYVKQVKRYDPEKHTDRFMVIQKAFDALKNPANRAKEDVQTFNYIKGEFLFNAEEQSNLTDEQIDQGLSSIQEMVEAGKVDEQTANAKRIRGYMIRSNKNHQKKLWGEAIEDWKRILEIEPTHRHAKNNLLYSLISLGYSYASHGLFEEAIDVWGQAVKMNPDDARLIHNIALAHQRAGQPQQADRYWQETLKRWKANLEREPDNEYLKTCIIEVLREQTKDPEAAPTPIAAPGGGGAPSRVAERKAPAPEAAPARSGTQTIEDFREIVRLNPNDFEAQYKVAMMLYNDQKWEESRKELADMRGKYPRNISVLNLLGWAMLKNNEVEGAFTTWRKARNMDPKNPQVTESLVKANMSLGRGFRSKGLYTRGLKHFKELTRYLPDSDEVHFEIGQTYQMKGDARSAYLEFQKALKLNPRHKQARNALSTLKMRR